MMAQTCRFCWKPAVAVFSMPRGCTCYPDDREQALCMQHVVRANPTGEMILTSDLTVGQKFSEWWNGPQGVKKEPTDG